MEFTHDDALKLKTPTCIVCASDFKEMLIRNLASFVNEQLSLGILVRDVISHRDSELAKVGIEADHASAAVAVKDLEKTSRRALRSSEYICTGAWVPEAE